MAVNFAKLPDLLRGHCRQARRDEDAAAHSRVRAMSACAPTADVSPQRGEPPLRAIIGREQMQQFVCEAKLIRSPRRRVR